MSEERKGPLAGLLDEDQRSIEEEHEYVFWCQVTQETLDELMALKTKRHFLDIFLKRLPNRTRVRVEGESATFTEKVKHPDGHNIEDNITIPTKVAKSYIRYAENIHRVTRINIPITNRGEPLLRNSGEQYMWEVDVFYNSGKGFEALGWVKVELEVDRMTTDRVKEIIPFDYESIIVEGDELNPTDRAQISDFWERRANIAVSD